MSTNNDSAYAGLMWVLTVIFTIAAGFLSWNWVEPDGFFGVIGFLFFWAVLSKVGHLLAMGITVLLCK